MFDKGLQKVLNEILRILKQGIIIDFGLSFEKKFLDFTSATSLKKYFYGYFPKMDVWCIDIHYICYLLHVHGRQVTVTCILSILRV